MSSDENKLREANGRTGVGKAVADEADDRTKAGKVAAAAVLATSLVGALNQPPRADLMSLPEPVPIVQQYDQFDDVDDEDDDERRETKPSLLVRLLALLKRLLVVLALVALLLLGVFRGCAGAVVGPGPTSGQDEQRQEQGHGGRTQQTDERGVALETGV